MAAPGWFERISSNDAQQLAADAAGAPANVGAVLVLDRPEAIGAWAQLLLQRISTIPRLRQRLLTAPPGCGRPYWADAPHFAPVDHLRILQCPSPGDDATLMALAVTEVAAPLDRKRPLWRAVLVTDLADGRVGLVMVMHHVLADGIGGLAVLGGLVDPPGSAPQPVAVPAIRPEPTRGALFAEAWRRRGAALRQGRRAWSQVRMALRELGTTRNRLAPRTSLNIPTGPRREAAVVSVPLAPVLTHAHRCAATVNDVLLLAAGGALDEVLASRGEDVDELVISVPISARTRADTGDLGNQVGAMPVRVPLRRPPESALAELAAATAARRTRTRGASAALLTPVFRALAAVGLFRALVNRQRLVNAFLTNMRGPTRPLAVGGATVRLIAPITMVTGNVAVAFAALSYAGMLTVTVIVDPDAVGELDLIADRLRAGLTTPT